MTTETDLRNLSIGQKFTRCWHQQHGVYTVAAKPHGSIGVEVVTESGKRGELLAWTRVIPV